MTKYARKPNHGAGPSDGRVTMKLNTEEHCLLRTCVALDGVAGSVMARQALMADVRRRLRRKGMLDEAIQRAKQSTQRRLQNRARKSAANT